MFKSLKVVALVTGAVVGLLFGANSVGASSLKWYTDANTIVYTATKAERVTVTNTAGVVYSGSAVLDSKGREPRYNPYKNLNARKMVVSLKRGDVLAVETSKGRLSVIAPHAKKSITVKKQSAKSYNKALAHLWLKVYPQFNGFMY